MRILPSEREERLRRCLITCRPRRSEATWAGLVATLLAVGAGNALAQDGAPATDIGGIEGTVLRAAAGEVVIDLGTSRGLPGGAMVHLYRRIEVTHPTTGEVLVDRFPIGTMPLEVGTVLSIGRDVSDLSQAPEVGDVVVWAPAADAMGTAAPDEPPRAAHTALPTNGSPSSQTASRPTDAPADPAVSAAADAFSRTLGRPIEERIGVWTGYLAAYPETPLLSQLVLEIAWLRREAEARDEPGVGLEPVVDGHLGTYVWSPDRVQAGRPLQVWAGIVERERVEHVRLLLRRAGEVTYVTVPMTSDGDFNWRAEAPSEFVEGPGRIEYFVEAVLDEGRIEVLGGSSSYPAAVIVDEEETDVSDRTGVSRVRASFDFVDFSTGPSVDDHYLRFESSYRYAVDFGVLSGFSVGIGIIEGVGGEVDRLNRGEPARSRTVNYGVAQLEFAFSRGVGGQVRLLAGNTSKSSDQSLSGVFGGGAGLRFGEADGTRLLLDASLTEEIGNQVSAEIVIAAVERVPMSGSAVVTNLPVGADYGVSLGYSIGYEFTDWLSLSARTGINARTTQHLGVMGGLGATLDW